MEGPTSSGGLRNRLTRLNLHEHNDDDDDDKIKFGNRVLGGLFKPKRNGVTGEGKKLHN
jgi:hypothetical protein